MTMNVVFLIGMVQAFFLAFVFVFKKNKMLADKILIAWLLLIAFHLLTTYLGAIGIYKDYPYFIFYGSSLMLLEGPFLYFYTAVATNRIRKFNVLFLVHIIPFVFFTSYFAYQVYGIEKIELYEYITNLFSDSTNITVQIFGLLNHFHIILYLIFSINLLKRHRKQLPNIFSFTEDVNLNWLKNIIHGITAISILIIIGLIISDIFPLVNHDFKASLIYSAFAFLPFYMSFCAIRQKIIYPNQNVEFNGTKYEFSGLSKKDSKELASRLSQIMENKKPYLDSKLTISELALELKLHPKQLSQVINENFNQNFFSFVNHYRVEEFKDRLADIKNENYTLIAIGYDCGFNTKSSFYSIFKKITGKTPSAYKSSFYRVQS